MQITEKELAYAIDYIAAGKYQSDEDGYKNMKKAALDMLESEGVRISEGTLFARVYFMALEGQE